MCGIKPPLPPPSLWGGPELSTGTTLSVSFSLHCAEEFYILSLFLEPIYLHPSFCGM
jgi:hypothetical protein